MNSVNPRWFLKSIFIIMVSCLGFTNMLASVITVGANKQVSSIREAIQRAEPNDTLIISHGYYREGNLIIEKPITLIGDGYPTLDGEDKFELLTIHANHVTIQGFKFTNTGTSSIEDRAGIKVLDSKNVRLFNNQFEKTFFGIYFANSSDCFIEDNVLIARPATDHQAGNGIHLWKCQRMTLKRNKIQGHRDGIYFEFVTNSLIADNRSEANIRYGLHFMFSHNDEYRHNEFINNGAGVAVMYTKKVRMFKNVFDHNWGASAYGLLLKDISDSYVKGNIFRTNSVGIHLEGCSRTEISENILVANGYAVRLQASCEKVNFHHNNFQANTFDMVSNGSLVLNTIDSNYWDKYDGYDLDKNNVGDVPFRPTSMFGTVVEQIPAAVLLWRSFLVFLMDRTERAIPAITPENLKDSSPAMKPYDLIQAGK